MISAHFPAVSTLVLVALLVGSACGASDEAAPTTDADAAAAPVTEATPEIDDDHADEEDHADDEDHADEEDQDEKGHDDHDDDDDEHDDHGDESSGLGAHEHGTAELSIAWIDTSVAIELVTPTFNVFGFEYEPESDEDVATEVERTDAITAPGIVAINDEAGCELIDSVETDVERDGSHSEITVSWSYECENADGVAEVDASGLFVEFPNFEDVDAQWVSDTQQSSAELSPSSATLSLQR